MSSSVQRHIEEFTDIAEQPVYLPGDKIRLRLRATHEVNLGSVWAIFRKLPERVEALSDPYIALPGKHYLLSRAGALRASDVHFEIEVCRGRHLPGDYELEAVRAYPCQGDGLEVRSDGSDEFAVKVVGPKPLLGPRPPLYGACHD